MAAKKKRKPSETPATVRSRRDTRATVVHGRQLMALALW